MDVEVVVRLNVILVVDIRAVMLPVAVHVALSAVRFVFGVVGGSADSEAG